MNLLRDALFTVQGDTATEVLALPRVLGRLLAGPEVTGFPNVAADQRSYWWRFLVRCGARAVRTAGLTVDEALGSDASSLSDTIRAALAEHSTEGDWELSQPEYARAGFLQVPTPTGAPPEEEGYKRNTCALLTAVIGTKEHERKSEINRSLDPEMVVYALIEYQGGVIFGGRGNYESQLTGSRSGAGSGTPFMGARLGRSNVLTFRHDVTVMLDRWTDTARDLQGDVWALWAEPWDGERPLPSRNLDPAFIPLARMVRLGPPTEDGRFDTVWFKSSKGSRVDDHTLGGRLGDPFTPLVPDPRGGHLKVRGTLQSGYGYKEVVKLLFPLSGEDGRPSPSVEAALRLGNDDRLIEAVFEGMAFEQGKTRGFHRRVVRIPPKVRGFETPKKIDAAHNMMLNNVAAAKRTLRSALSIYLTGEPRVRDDDRAKLRFVTGRLDDMVDRRYLDYLFDAVASDSEDATAAFRRWLRGGVVNDLFPEAVRSLPTATAARREREVKAEAYLRGRLKRELNLEQRNHTGEEAA